MTVLWLCRRVPPEPTNAGRRGRRWQHLVIIGAALLLLAEAAIRLSGITDFPTYAVDDGIGYIIKPNQAGKFLDRNAWAFNDRSMPLADSWNPGKRPNLLLIGNSIIMGGNPYPQQAKVGPLLQRELGDQVAVWPSAIGGWSTVNETAYLERNPDVVAANAFFVWELMDGGFSRLSQWRGDYVFPRRKPLCATCYVFRRYLLPRLVPLHDDELPPSGAAAGQNILRFEHMIAALCAASPTRIHGVLLLYPARTQLTAARHGEEWLPDRPVLQRIADRYGLRVLDVSQQPEWNEASYRADGVHPNAEANVRLAHIIAAAIRASYPLSN